MNELGFQVRLKGPFEEVRQKAIDALKVEGFGVLTEIDVSSTLKQKLDVEFRRYVILGACNPPLAHRALTADLGVGLFLPCNVTVHEEDEVMVVTAVNPIAMLGALKDNPQISGVAQEAQEKLRRVIDSLK